MLVSSSIVILIEEVFLPLYKSIKSFTGISTTLEKLSVSSLVTKFKIIFLLPASYSAVSKIKSFLN